MSDHMSESSDTTMDDPQGSGAAPAGVANREVLELRKLRREMSSTDAMNPADEFLDLVRERAADIAPSWMKVSEEAIRAAQAATEAHVVRLFDTAQELAIHAGQRMVRQRDLVLAQKLAGIWPEGFVEASIRPCDSSSNWEELRGPNYEAMDEEGDEYTDPEGATDDDYHTDELTESDWETVDGDEVVDAFEVLKRDAEDDAIPGSNIKRQRVSANGGCMCSARPGQEFNPIVID